MLVHKTVKNNSEAKTEEEEIQIIDATWYHHAFRNLQQQLQMRKAEGTGEVMHLLEAMGQPLDQSDTPLKDSVPSQTSPCLPSSSSPTTLILQWNLAIRVECMREEVETRQPATQLHHLTPKCP